MNSTITVLIVDDHVIVRQGIITFLGLQPGITIVGEATSGREAVQMCVESAPDVVLMDLLMPEMNGVEATRQIKQVSPRTQVIILTSHHNDEHLLPAIRAGALSYLLKDVSPTELLDAVRRAAHGETFIHPSVAARMMRTLSRSPAGMEDGRTELSQRELEVLRLIAEGLPNQEIAEHLCISDKTVKSHVSNILGKLHLNDRTQAAVYAWRNGITQNQ